jgi:hypothetical protein
LVLNPSEVALGPVVARARVLVHEVTRTEELAKRQRARSADHAGLEEHRAWYELSTRGLVVKQVDAAELRIVVATLLSVAADVVHVYNLARRSSLEAGSTRQRKGGKGWSNVRNSVWRFGTETRKAGGTRASIPNKKMK